MPRNMLDGITEYDVSWLISSDTDPSVYTGNARFSQGFFDGAASIGHGVVLMIQETISERSQQGYQAGVYDVQFARARAKQRGFTGPIAYVVSDGWSGNRWDSSEYGRGISDTEEGQFLGYGAKGVLESFYVGARAGAGAHFIHPAGDEPNGDWGPETWGVYSLITQLVGPSPVPDTDLNIVHYPLGVSAPAPTPVWKDYDMHIGVNKAEGWFVVDGGKLTSHFTGPDVGFGVPQDATTGQWPNVPAKVYTDAEVAELKKGLNLGGTISVGIDYEKMAQAVTAGMRGL